MLCSLEFFSLSSAISFSCLSIFFSRDLTSIFKELLFSVSILTFSLFYFNSVSASFKIIDNFCIFVYSLLVESTCWRIFSILSLSLLFRIYLSFLIGVIFKLLTIHLTSLELLSSSNDFLLAISNRYLFLDNSSCISISSRMFIFISLFLPFFSF